MTSHDYIPVREIPSALSVRSGEHILVASDLTRMALLFTNALNAYFGFAVTAPTAIKKGKIMRVVGDAAAIAMTGIVMAAMTGMFSGDDDEEKKKKAAMAVGAQLTDSIPLVGSAISNLLFSEVSRARSAINLFPAFDDLGYVKRDLENGDYTGAIMAAMIASLRASGLPAVQIRRIIKAVETGEPLEAIGIRRQQ